MLSAIAKPFGWLMLGLYNFFSDYGIAIFAFALVVRLVLLPFSAKSKKSLMRSSRLQPLMKELEKHFLRAADKLGLFARKEGEQT